MWELQEAGLLHADRLTVTGLSMAANLQGRESADREMIRPFAAYGVTPNGDDPLSKALRGLIENAVKQEERIERLMTTMRAAGLECQGVPECDKLNSDQLNKLVE